METKIDYEGMAKERNKANAFANKIGIQVTAISKGYAEAVMEIDDTYMNPVGTLHGGCTYSLADVVSGATACSNGKRYVTLEGKINYLSAVVNESKIVAVGRAIKDGRKISVINVEIMDINKKKLYATAVFTMYAID